MSEVMNPKAPVTLGVTFLGANWRSPMATTTSMAALTRARSRSSDCFILFWYCSFCKWPHNKQVGNLTTYKVLHALVYDQSVSETRVYVPHIYLCPSALWQASSLILIAFSALQAAKSETHTSLRCRKLEAYAKHCICNNIIYLNETCTGGRNHPAV